MFTDLGLIMVWLNDADNKQVLQTGFADRFCGQILQLRGDQIPV
jgi:hypothetical protein